jgi:hypothetical protein
MRWLKTTFLILLCAVLAFANDSAFHGVGGSLRPMRGEHPLIRMVREHVQIELHGDFYRTRVDFEFQNTSNRPVTVTMGFPERGSGDVDAGAARRRTTFRRFATWVDDRPTPARRIVARANTEEQTYQAYWTKQVSFTPRAVRRVRVEYESPMSGTVADSFTWRAPYDFTGGNWQGQVAESRLTVRAVAPGIYVLRAQQSSNNSEDVSEPRTIQLTREGDAFTHTWRNWEAEASFDLGIMATAPGGLALGGASGMFDSFNVFQRTNQRDIITVPPTRGMSVEDYEINIYPPVIRRGTRDFIALNALRSRLDSQAEEAGQRDAVEMNYDGQNAPVRLRAGRYTMQFRAGSSAAQINGRTVTMPAAAFQLGRDGEIYVPLETVLQALNGQQAINRSLEVVNLNIPAFW